MKYSDLKIKVLNQAVACGRNPSEITVIAVSKGHPWNQIESVYMEGCRNFGESRFIEANEKMNVAPQDIEWHLIGTLQSNKVVKVVGKFSLIHSVDQPSLLAKISQVSEQREIETSVLIQVNTSGEQSKHGLSTDQWRKELAVLVDLPAINICGLMTMAPNTSDESIIRQAFKDLRLFRDELREMYGEIHSFHHLSMGMSNDYLIAVEEGATLLRIGSLLFE